MNDFLTNDLACATDAGSASGAVGIDWKAYIGDAISGISINSSPLKTVDIHTGVTTAVNPVLGESEEEDFAFDEDTLEDVVKESVHRVLKDYRYKTEKQPNIEKYHLKHK